MGYNAVEELPAPILDTLAPSKAEEWRVAFNEAEAAGASAPHEEAWEALLDEAAGRPGSFSYTVDLSDMDFAEVSGKEPIERWIQALPLKTFEHPAFGTIKITPERVKRFASNVNKRVRGIDLDVDYEHKRSVQGGKAAGWIKRAKAGARGLELLVEFNPPAVEALKNHEYRYFSAEIKDRWCHPETKKCYDDVLFGGALTNRPFLKGIAPINLSELFPNAKAKFSQEDAGFREAVMSTRRCANCAFFDGKNSCLIVGGEINGDSVSRYFQPIYRGEGGMLPLDERPEEDLAQWFAEAEAQEYRDIPESERKGHPSSDFAWPETRSFPIFKPEDVAAAARSMGRLKNPTSDRLARLRSNIIRIAKRKGWASSLPEAWRKQMDEFLKALAEKLGIEFKEDDSEGVQEAILAWEPPEPSEREEGGSQAKKFADEYPEEATRLAEVEEENRGHRIERAVMTFEEQTLQGGSPKRALTPESNEGLRGFLMKLSEGHATELLELLGKVFSEGIVDLSERGKANGEGTADASERVEKAAYALMDEAKEAGKTLSFRDALDRVLDEQPELAKGYVSQAPVVSVGEGEE